MAVYSRKPHASVYSCLHSKRVKCEQVPVELKNGLSFPVQGFFPNGFSTKKAPHHSKCVYALCGWILPRSSSCKSSLPGHCLIECRYFEMCFEHGLCSMCAFDELLSSCWSLCDALGYFGERGRRPWQKLRNGLHIVGSWITFGPLWRIGVSLVALRFSTVVNVGPVYAGVSVDTC
jgi:hypothetical protein